jgi:hypothetical protein
MRGSAAFRVGVAPGGALAPSWVRDSVSRAARSTPSLDLRFADNKSLIDATSGQSLVTFTRASSGTYVGSEGLIKTATTNEARFDHNPTTGESLGLLVEEQRTNLIVQSENFETTWLTTGLLAFGSGSTLNATVAPDGQTTADLLTENSSTSEHRVETAAISWVANTTYTLTIFAKANGRTRMDVFGVGGGNFTGGRNASFNLSTGAVITTDGAVASIEARANAYYRIRMTFTASAAPSASALFIRFLDNSNNFSYAGDGTSGIYLWGAQLEAGSFPTSYIPTTSATVTRSADVASITGANFSSWYNQTEGTLYIESTKMSIPVTTNTTFADLNDGTVSNRSRFWIWSGATSTLRFTPRASSADQADLTIGTPIQNIPFKAAGSLKVNDFAAVLNGGTVSTDGSGTVPTVDRLTIGNSGSANEQLGGTIRRLTYWPSRLPNSTLQEITR